ncbi:MAG: D-alanyl-D-alanine carboxypeptidase [Actinobacteria bacterium]|nr:MAG: D-alanyl-D-alanine carboxypeptidase [Actinomycetota bacterium]
MSKRAYVAAAVVLAASWGFSLLVLVDPGLLGSDGQAGSPAPPARAAVHTSKPQRPEPVSRFTLQSAPTRLPVQVAFAHAPRAGILFDVHSGQVLWQHDAGRRLPIASLTKMITALIIARRDRPDERVLITPQALAYKGSGIGVLPKGKQIPLRDLFDGLLLVSGNDAAIALAQHDSGSVPAFVRRMNAWRDRLGLGCSHFSSPSGILDEGNYSCPRDLAVLARADLANQRIRRVVGARHARFPFPVKGGYLDLYNNNPFILMGMKGITGLKTGYTDAAGRCYVTTRRRDGHELGVVLLNTPNPLDQVPALLRAGARALRG